MTLRAVLGFYYMFCTIIEDCWKFGLQFIPYGFEGFSPVNVDESSFRGCEAAQFCVNDTPTPMVCECMHFSEGFALVLYVA